MNLRAFGTVRLPRSRALVCLVAALTLASVGQLAAAPTPYDYWSFDAPANRLATTSGSGSMSLVGTSYSYVAGPNGASDGAIQLSGTDSTYLRCYHNMAANGGGSQVNAYTLMWDVKYPNSGSYKCLLQTANPTANDGDVFINGSGKVGSSSNLGGYGGSTSPNTWYRIVLVVNTSSGSGDYDGKVFVNGSKVEQVYNLNTDSTLCLYAGSGGSFEIHLDDNGENDTLVLAGFACWSSALSESDVASLGGPGAPLLKNSQSISFGALPARTYGDAPFALSASADSGLPVSFSVVSGPATISGSTVTLTGAGTVTIRASQAGDGNFNAAANVDQSFTAGKASQAAVTWSALPTQIYGATVNLASYASGGSGTGAWVFGVVSGPASVNGGTATFGGVGSVVFSACRAGDANYNTSATASSAAVAVNRATPSVTAWPVASAIVYGQPLSASALSGGSATVAGSFGFSAPNAQPAAGACSASVTFAPADGADYASVSGTVNVPVNPKALAVTGLSASSRPYNGTTAAVLTGAPGTLSGVVGNDAVSLTGTPVGAFADKNVGVGKTVAVSGLGLAGAQAGNYTLAAPVLTAAITAAPVTVASGLAAQDRSYDHTAVITLRSNSVALSGVLPAEAANVGLCTNGYAAAVAAAGAGTNIAVAVSGLSLTGIAAGNYSLVQPALSVNITPAPLTVTGLSAQNKVYDGKTAATVVGAPVLAGVFGADRVTLQGGASGAFDTALVGIHKPVQLAGLSVGGADATNYAFSLPALFADITGTPPVAGAYVMGTSRDCSNALAVAKLLRVCADPNGYDLNISAVTSTSARSGSVRLGGGLITYMPAAGFVGTDSFQYTVQNVAGCVAQGTVTVVVRPADGDAPSVLGPPQISGGIATIRFAGIPGLTYDIQASGDLVNWVTIGSATAGSNGLFQFEDQDAGTQPIRFYRCRMP